MFADFGVPFDLTSVFAYVSSLQTKWELVNLTRVFLNIGILQNVMPFNITSILADIVNLQKMYCN